MMSEQNDRRITDEILDWLLAEMGPGIRPALMRVQPDGSITFTELDISPRDWLRADLERQLEIGRAYERQLKISRAMAPFSPD